MREECVLARIQPLIVNPDGPVQLSKAALMSVTSWVVGVSSLLVLCCSQIILNVKYYIPLFPLFHLASFLMYSQRNLHYGVHLDLASSMVVEIYVWRCGIISGATRLGESKVQI